MRILTKQEIEAYDSIFDNIDISREARGQSPLLAETICLNTDDETSITLEITLNIAPTILKKYGCKLSQVEYYKRILEEFCTEYKAVNSYHTIEFCKNGAPHLHGYVNLKVPNKAYSFDKELLLKMYLTTFLKGMPDSYFKQLAKYQYDDRFKRIKTPSVCINLKECLSEGWTDYINKNASK